MIVPVIWWIGEKDAPGITPSGVRAGDSNGERTLTAVVGPPGAAVGSAGTTGVVGAVGL